MGKRGPCGFPLPARWVLWGSFGEVLFAAAAGTVPATRMGTALATGTHLALPGLQLPPPSAKHHLDAAFTPEGSQNPGGLLLGYHGPGYFHTALFLAQFGPKLKDLSSGIQQSPATWAVGSAAAKGVREYLTAAKCLQSPRRVVAASRHWWIAAAPHFTPCLQKCLFPFFGPQSGRKLGWGMNKVGEGRDAGKEMHRGMHRHPRTQHWLWGDAGLCAASTHPKHFVFGRCPRACQDGQVRKPTCPQLPPPPHKPWQPAPHTLQRSCPFLLPLEACTDPQPGRVKGMLVSPTP